MQRDTRKVIQRLQLLIEHQMRSYFYARVIWVFSYICLVGIRALGESGKTESKYPKNHMNWHMKSNLNSLAQHVTSSKLLLWCLGPLRFQLYLFYRYLGIETILGNWAQIPRIVSRNTQKIQGFQHHISHWMRPYSSVKTIWRLSYTNWMEADLILKKMWLQWALEKHG